MRAGLHLAEGGAGRTPYALGVGYERQEGSAGRVLLWRPRGKGQ